MMSLAIVFWMYVILFAIIGGMRGWAKEILVSFSVILALAFIALLNITFLLSETYSSPKKVPPFSGLRTSILILLVFFGYQTVNYSTLSAKVTVRNCGTHAFWVSSSGAINGYLMPGRSGSICQMPSIALQISFLAPTGTIATNSRLTCSVTCRRTPCIPAFTSR